MNSSANKIDPKDLSSLYFSNATTTTAASSSPVAVVDASPYVGPVAVVRSTTAVAVSDNPAVISRGRCLLATRNIAVGELLFVTPPVLSTPVMEVHTEWKKKRNAADTATAATTTTVAEAAERVLWHQYSRAANDRTKVGILRSLSALEGSMLHCDVSAIPSLARLLGNEHETAKVEESMASVLLSEADVLQIIRRNAFGPDFVTTETIERRWRLQNDDGQTYRPARILGVYPLAAMLNHSCIPNAVRVYVGEIMIVHACQTIAQGDEIVWSYISLIQSYAVRQAVLKETHGFACFCERCRLEALLPPDILRQVNHCGKNVSVSKAVFELENNVLPNKLLANEVKRYLRVSHLQVYMDYLNIALASDAVDKHENLSLCTQLHFSLAASHNASTEHISVRQQVEGACFAHSTIPGALVSHTLALLWSYVCTHRFYTCATNWPVPCTPSRTLRRKLYCRSASGRNS